MPPSLQGIAKKAQRQKRYRFRNRYGMLNEELRQNCGSEAPHRPAYTLSKNMAS